MDLFDHAYQKKHIASPLADRVRPSALDQILGQDHLLAKGRPIRQAIEQDRLPSLILWGPPGAGKTTLALIIAKYSRAHFQSYSAVTSGIKELKQVLTEAEQLLKYQQKKTILFIDEIHRFNKAQQDAFLPYVEQGQVTLIGATTENPSFEVNNALLSRCQVLVLKALEQEQLQQLLERTILDQVNGLGQLKLEFEKDVIAFIANRAQGDARMALNQLEMVADFCHAKKDSSMVTLKDVEEATFKKALPYDKSGDEHYNLISALHKSIRGSDPDAALYWLTRMLEAGEDPRYLLRRMSRMASEDIGLADPNALTMAASARQTFDLIGLPEGALALAQLAVYLSLAPKSNALEIGYQQVQAEIQENGPLPVPLHLRNAPTRLMKNLGYGKEYKYAHDFEGHWVIDDYLPQQIKTKRFFYPTNDGWEGDKKILLENRLKQREEARQDKTTE